MKRITVLLVLPILIAGCGGALMTAGTFVNPVLPGDHPDPSLLKKGDDFYTTGSTFNLAPCIEILHSKDLVHWEIISRVVDPNWELQESPPEGVGGLGGTITFFYGKYWVYFGLKNGRQYVCSADNPRGPWTEPEALAEGTGHDNSVFVDDDGTPYTLVKHNGFWELGPDGKTIGSPQKMDFILNNKSNRHAEGPVVFKRNGFYYWCVAFSAGANEIVYKSNYNTMPLRNGSGNWTRLGNFSEVGGNPFRAPNHHSITVQISDGTWWNLCQSFWESDWDGLGRVGVLSQVVWNGDIPKCIDPTAKPLPAPNLPDGGIGIKMPYSDHFSRPTLDLTWNFFGKTPPSKWSLSDRPDWMTLKPDTGRMMLLQKVAEKNYSIATRIDFEATASSHEAGLIQTNGDVTEYLKIVSTFDSERKIKLIYNGSTDASVTNTIGNQLWLKLEKTGHTAKGYYSSDGSSWIQLGSSVNTGSLDDSFVEWIGNYQGLYCNAGNAYFDQYNYYNAKGELMVSAKASDPEGIRTLNLRIDSPF